VANHPRPVVSECCPRQRYSLHLSSGESDYQGLELKAHNTYREWASNVMTMTIASVGILSLSIMVACLDPYAHLTKKLKISSLSSFYTSYMAIPNRWDLLLFLPLPIIYIIGYPTLGVCTPFYGIVDA
jgi:hypothetical protein